MKPPLLVPIRDRRQHRRFVTKKNLGLLAGLVVVVYIALSFDDVLWRRSSAGDGRLAQSATVRKELPSSTQPIVEGPAAVADQTVPDPLLIAPAARAQELLAPPPAPAPAPAPVRAESAAVRVEGDAAGITIVRSSAATAKRPVLAGGIFKSRE